MRSGLLMEHAGKLADCIINTTKLPYTQDGLWAKVKEETVRELFWQFLRARNVSHVQEGKAPMNAAKASAIAEQAPDAMKFLKHLCLVAPDDMQPRDGQGLLGNNSSQALPGAVMDQPDCLTLKERALGTRSEAMTTLFGDQYEKALLADDMARRDGQYINVPTSHLYGCIARHIQGQRYTTINEGIFKKDLERVGLEVGVHSRDAGIQIRSTVQLPTIQGLRYMIKSKGYMTDDELAKADQACID